MCAHARQLRCSTATAETANAPVALLSLLASLSWYRTQKSSVRRRRTRFVLAAVVSPLAAFAPIVAPLYSRVAKLLRDLCPSAFPRCTISRSFSRCWTSGHLDIQCTTVGLPRSCNSSLSSVALVRPNALPPNKSPERSRDRYSALSWRCPTILQISMLGGFAATAMAAILRFVQAKPM
jgi:hypothetical protein